MIESNQNKIYKEIKSLKSKKERDEKGLFIAEGIKFVSEIPEKLHVNFFAVSEKFVQENNIDTLEKKSEVFVFSNNIFKGLSNTENPQGIIAICQKPAYDNLNILNKNGIFIIAEELNDPGNLGTIIRTADACAVDSIFLTKGSVDLYNEKVLRATMGSLFHLPIYQNVDILYVTEQMKIRGINIFAAHLDGKSYLYDFDLNKSCAFLIGNEARGLSSTAVNLADNLIKIPMLGYAQSLNAAVAASVIMYEAVRQRLVLGGTT